MIKVPEKIGGLPVLFVATVLVPTVVAAIYLSLRSDIYTSESRFVVQSSEKQQQTGLGALFKATGFSAASEEAFAANDYIKSRDALQALNKNDAVLHAYTRPSIALLDRFNAFGWGGGRDRLFDYYDEMVTVKYDLRRASRRLRSRPIRLLMPRKSICSCWSRRNSWSIG